MNDVLPNSKLQKSFISIMVIVGQQINNGTGSLHVKFDQIDWLNLNFRLNLLKKKLFNNSYRTCFLC